MHDFFGMLVFFGFLAMCETAAARRPAFAAALRAASSAKLPA